jgi:tetratricopeptide (TPR) repeat protein
VREFSAVKYRILLSYCQRDKALGRWLQRELEAYRIEEDFVGRATLAGPVPRTLRPIFRSREEGGDILTEQTSAALQAAQFLVVLCSPDAAKSQHINELIRRFNAMRRADRVIPVLVGGEPGDPEIECFPPALRFRLGPDRRPTNPYGEPIPDARPDGDGKELARRKVLARVLGLGLDDVARNGECTRQRLIRARCAVAAGLLAITMAYEGGFAWARYELNRDDVLLDRILESATAATSKAVALSRQAGVPRAVSLALLAEAEDRVRNLAELGRETSQLRFRKASMLIEFARHYAALGNDELQQARATEAGQLMQRLAAEAPGRLVRDLSVTYNELGDVMQAQGRLKEALASYRASRALVDRLAANPDNAGRQRELAANHLRIGNVDAAQGALDAALASYQTSLAIDARGAAPNERDTRRLYGLMVSQEKIGDVLRVQGELEEALASYQASRATAEELTAAEPGNADWQRGLAVARIKIGDVLAAQGKHDEALTSYRASNAVARRLAAIEPGNAGWQNDLGLSHERMGFVLEARGDLVPALKEYRTSLAIASRLAAADPGNAGWQRDLGIAHEHIGDVLRVQGNHGGALKEYEAKRAIVSLLAAADPGNAGWQYELGSIHARLGVALEARGDLEAALKEYEACLRIGSRFAAAEPAHAGWQRDLAVTHGKLAAVHHRLGKARQALADLRAGRDIMAVLVRTAPAFEPWTSDLAQFDSQIATLEGRAPAKRAARGCDFNCEKAKAAGPDAVKLASDLREGNEPVAAPKSKN